MDDKVKNVPLTAAGTEDGQTQEEKRAAAVAKQNEEIELELEDAELDTSDVEIHTDEQSAAVTARN